LSVAAVIDPSFLATLQNREPSEMQQRFAQGHRAYVAYLDGEPAAWGWVAIRSASIGELGSSFRIPEGERYLWNFVTRPEYRGRGIYPRLLRAILESEAYDAERFWIAYAPENHASASGIAKAGFVPVAELSFSEDGSPAVSDLAPGGGARAARLLGVPEARESLAACWKCIRAGKSAERACREGSCCCDYQQPEIVCS
jgi:GNAT superfamily N-acetyltransferase